MNSEYQSILKEFNKQLHKEVLKPRGFKKRNNSYNRVVEDDIIQVINFQAGQYPIGKHYIIPGIRESYYGKFTVNLGVYVPDIDIDKRANNKNFINEYNCHIRTRLYELKKNKTDKWWELYNSSNFITSRKQKKVFDEVQDLINNYAFDFFDSFSTRELIIKNREEYRKRIHDSPRWQLDNALIYIGMGDIVNCLLAFQSHYDRTKVEGHKKYLRELAIQLGIDNKLNLLD